MGEGDSEDGGGRTEPGGRRGEGREGVEEGGVGRVVAKRRREG